ncbi:MAG: hypothetical protein WC952_11435 [Desulfobulbaceae bacterium]
MFLSLLKQCEAKNRVFFFVFLFALSGCLDSHYCTEYSDHLECEDWWPYDPVQRSFCTMEGCYIEERCTDLSPNSADTDANNSTDTAYNTDTNTGTNAGTDTGIDTGADISTDASTDTGTDIGTGTDANSASDTFANSDTEVRSRVCKKVCAGAVPSCSNFHSKKTCESHRWCGWTSGI